MSKRSIERPTHPATGNTTQTEAIGPGDTGPMRTANHPHLQRIAHTHPMFRMTPALLTFQRRRILKNEQKCSTHWFGSDMTQTPIRILSDPVPNRVAPLGHNSAIEMQLLHQPRFQPNHACFLYVIKNTSAMRNSAMIGEHVFITDENRFINLTSHQNHSRAMTSESGTRQHPRLRKRRARRASQHRVSPRRP